MIRFWKGFVGAIVGFLVLWNAFFFAFPRLIFAYDYAVWEAKFDLLKSETESSEVLILGDSQAVSGLLATGTKRKTLSLGLSCGGPIEAAYIYDRYLEHHSPPRFLVLEFVEGYYHDTNCFREFTFPYDFIGLSDRAAILKEFDDAGLHVPMFEDGEKTLDALRVPARVRTSLYLGLTALHLSAEQIAYARNVFDVTLWRDYADDYRSTIADRGHLIIGLYDVESRARNRLPNVEEFRPNPVIVRHLERTLDRAARDGTKVLLRIGPWNPATVSKYSARFKTQLAEFMDAVSARYPNAKVERAMRTWPDFAFGDPDVHLNSRGALMESDHLEDALDAFEAELGEVKR